MLADKRYCYSLTIADVDSRDLICCEALSTMQDFREGRDECRRSEPLCRAL